MLNTSAQTERLQRVGSAAAGIAHDINNQLTLIVNHLSLPDVEEARRAIDRCAALTANLLSYCRGESPALVALDHAAFLRAFITRMPLPAGVRLHTAIPATLPAIAADPLALARALTNLLSNACAAMNNQGAITLSASERAIEISDSGPGIPPELARAIFEPFFTTKGAAGTGLGLSIVRDIMRQHGGSISAFSEPGRGARFTLRFKAANGCGN